MSQVATHASGVDQGRRRLGDPVDVLTVYLGLLFLIPAPLVFEPLGGAGQPSTLFGVGLLVWWLLAGLVPGWRPSIMQPMHGAVLLLVLAVLASYAMAMTDPRLPIEVRGADRGLIRMASLVGVYLFAADGLRSMEQINRLISRIVALASVVATIGLVQFLFGIDIAAMIHVPGLSVNGILVTEDRSLFLRIRATASHPLESGMVLAMALPLALYLVLGSRRRQLWPQLSLVVIGVVALMSVSRSAVLGVGIAGLVVFLGWDRKRQVIALLLSPFILVALRLAVPGLLGTLRSLFANVGNDPSISGRTDDYEIVMSYIAARPMTGLGFGTFIPSVYFTLDNQYLLMLVEGGLFGLVSLIIFFVVAWCCARGSRLRSTDEDDRQLGQAMAAAIAVAAIASTLFDLLSFPMLSGLTFLVVGAAAAAWRTVQSPDHLGRRLLRSPDATRIDRAAGVER
jgi:polysaccharide biosynthesis protein PslJ